MKIREANPDFKQFEASEEDFDKQTIDDCERTLTYILNSDSEELKSLQESGVDLKQVVNYAVKVVMCYRFGIKPSCIQIENEEINERTKNSDRAMTFGRVGRYLRRKGVYGVVSVYPAMQESDNLIKYLLSLLHEFRHIWQHIQKERGYFVLGFVDGNERMETDFDKIWHFLKYATNFNEFDANIFASSVLKKFMKNGESKKYLPKNEYKRVKSCINTRIATAWISFVIGSVDKAFVGVCLAPYLIGKKISENVGYKYPSSYLFDLIDECNEENAKRGLRNKNKAQEFLRRSRVQREFGLNEKIRIVDSMLVVFASKHNIESNFGFALSNGDNVEGGFDFVGREELGDDEKIFGYIIATKKQLESYQGVEFFDKMVEAFVSLEQNDEFVNALNKYKQKTYLENSENVG